jgi:rhodanese-related sulfurtransferase
MKLLKTCAIALAVTVPMAFQTNSACGKEQSTQQHPFGMIDAQGLETLLSSKTPFELVDARTDKWFDGTLISGAKRLPSDSSDSAIAETLSNKEKLVVVYCGGEKCPASKDLAQRLVDAGYKHVLDYHGGITEWKALNKPTQTL